MTKVRVFVVEDHAMVREGLKRLIATEPDMEIAGESSNGEDAVATASVVRPEVLLMDISMPGLTGLQAAARLNRQCPETKIIVLTAHEDRSYVREAFAAGAVGFLSKRGAADELVRAIRAVVAGGVHVDPRIAEKLFDRSAGGATKEAVRPAASRLTDREADVLRQIAFGYSNKEIAAKLEISVKTVETYKARAMEKLQLRSRVDIIRIATERGWFSQPEHPA